MRKPNRLLSFVLAGALCALCVIAAPATVVGRDIGLSPQCLLLGKVQSGDVEMHTNIPISWVDRSSLELDGLPATGSYADALGNLVAVFDETAVKEMVSPPSATLTLTGYYNAGGSFAVSDTVSVKASRGR